MLTFDLVPMHQWHHFRGPQAQWHAAIYIIINTKLGCTLLFVDPPNVELGGPDVAKVCIPPGEQLYMGKFDLKNYYHCLAHSCGMDHPLLRFPVIAGKKRRRKHKV